MHLPRVHFGGACMLCCPQIEAPKPKKPRSGRSLTVFRLSELDVRSGCRDRPAARTNARVSAAAAAATHMRRRLRHDRACVNSRLGPSGLGPRLRRAQPSNWDKRYRSYRAPLAFGGASVGCLAGRDYQSGCRDNGIHRSCDCCGTPAFKPPPCAAAEVDSANAVKNMTGRSILNLTQAAN